MKNKKIIALGLTALLGVGIAAAVGTSIGSSLAGANVECTGHHYAQVNPTLVESGVKEYWVCCEHHEIFFEQPTVGEWPTAAHEDGFKVGKDDERYISRLINENLDITYDEETGEITINDFEDYDVVYTIDEDTGDIDVTSVGGDERFTYDVNEDGEITVEGIKNIYDFRQDGDTGKYDITIPDGVTEVDLQDAFKNKNIGTVVIPATVTDLGEGEENMFYNVNDIDKVVYEGNGKDFLTNGLFANMIEACWKTYKDHSSRLQPYMPTEIVLDGVSYFTSNKVMGDFLNGSGKSSAGYVFYYRDAVPTKMTTAKGKTYSIDICGKDTKKLNAAFGRDNHETFINEENL